MNDFEVRQEAKRSNVRIYVTYLFAWAYILLTAAILYALLRDPAAKIETILALATGFGSIATGFIGFWFGGRSVASDITKSIEQQVGIATTNQTAGDSSDSVYLKSILNDTAPPPPPLKSLKV
jgi:hypothetical protein